MAFDLGKLLDQVSSTVASNKGFSNVSDLIAVKAGNEITRQVDKVNTTKQTPPVVQPTAYSLEMLNEISPVSGVTRGQLLAIGAISLVAVYFLLKRR